MTAQMDMMRTRGYAQQVDFDSDDDDDEKFLENIIFFFFLVSCFLDFWMSENTVRRIIGWVGAPDGRSGQCQVGPKGCQLELGPGGAPKLLDLK